MLLFAQHTVIKKHVVQPNPVKTVGRFVDIRLNRLNASLFVVILQCIISQNIRLHAISTLVISHSLSPSLLNPKDAINEKIQQKESSETNT